MKLSCLICPEDFEVSEEDPDATLSDLRAHLGCHTQDRQAREVLFAQIQEHAS